MRISTSQLYDQNIRAIMENQREMTQTQEALSTGKRINRPSDDPVGAAKVVRLTEELDNLNQYQRNNDLLKNNLEQQEAVLTGINDSVTRARTLIIQAGSGAMSATDQRAIGTEIAQIRDEVIALMNAQNANGDYIFAGYQSQTPAFSLNEASSGQNVIFNGDSGENQVKLSDGVSVRSTVSGQDLFADVQGRRTFAITGNSPGTTVNSATIEQQSAFDAFSKSNYDAVTPANNNYELEILASGQAQLTNTGTNTVVETVDFASGTPFTIKGMNFNLNAATGDTVSFSLDQPTKTSLPETLHDLSQILTQSIDGQNIDEAISDALNGLDNGLEKVALERSSIGGRLNIAESVYETNLDLELAAKGARSAIQDTDYAEASAEFAKQETALNAALATFPKVTNLSLFNYI